MSNYAENAVELKTMQPQAAPQPAAATVPAAPETQNPNTVQATAATAVVDADLTATFDPNAVSPHLRTLKNTVEGTKMRFAILNLPGKDAYRHYEPNSKCYVISPYQRHGGRVVGATDEFTPLLGDAHFCRALLVYHYALANPQTGKLATIEAAATGSVQGLVVGAKVWASIFGAVPEDSTLYDVDFSCSPRANGKGMDFVYQGKSVFKMTPPDFQAKVMSDAKRLHEQLEGRIGKRLGIVGVKMLVAKNRPTTTECDLKDLDVAGY